MRRGVQLPFHGGPIELVFLWCAKGPGKSRRRLVATGSEKTDKDPKRCNSVFYGFCLRLDWEKCLSWNDEFKKKCNKARWQMKMVRLLLLWCIKWYWWDSIFIWFEGLKLRFLAMLQRFCSIQSLPSGDIMCNHYDQKCFGNCVFDILCTFVEAIWNSRSPFFGWSNSDRWESINRFCKPITGCENVYPCISSSNVSVFQVEKNVSMLVSGSILDI